MIVSVCSGLLSSFVENANAVETSHNHVSSHHSQNDGDGDTPINHCFEKCIKSTLLTSPTKEKKFTGFSASYFVLYLNVLIYPGEYDNSDNANISEIGSVETGFPDILHISSRLRI
ncbi:MAG: hypothetical protein ACRBBN_00240 [Methyloligellaceae bacterium]